MKYTNVMKDDPPARVPLNVIFDDNITRRVFWNDNTECFEPAEWWETSHPPIKDANGEPLKWWSKLEALAWCVI